MQVQRARKVAGIAILLVIALGLIKATVGYLAGSVALQADAVHTLADLLAILASWFGLSLALRPASERFPYGFYRAETLAALIASGVITVMGIGLLHEAVGRVIRPPQMERPFLTIGMGCFSALAAVLISRWEAKAARSANSQSLSATAEETRMDALSSALVLISGLGAVAGVPWLDGIVGAFIACVIMLVGLSNLKTSVLSLMDASVNPEMERKIEDLLMNVAGVRNVEKVLLRRAGPFYFLDGHIRVAPSLEVARGHEIAHEAQSMVQEEFPSVESVMFHVEPDRSGEQRVMVPVVESSGLDAPLSDHFGRAPFFLCARFERNRLTGHEVMENAESERAVRAGLAAIKDLQAERNFEVVICREIGEISFHALRDRLVEVFRTDAQTAREALEAFAANELTPLSEPTHSSEKKLEEDESAAGRR
jgi:cation diffusion facilitator family transporter